MVVLKAGRGHNRFIEIRCSGNRFFQLHCMHAPSHIVMLNAVDTRLEMRVGVSVKILQIFNTDSSTSVYLL